MKILTILALLFFASDGSAQHLRIYACAIANDSVGASMGGSSNGSGLYQSDDTGKTWKHLGWDNIKCYSMDMVQSSNGRILYEATGLGILRSTDYGAHWKQITDWRISEAMEIVIDQFGTSWHGDSISFGTANNKNWWSYDGGKNWNWFQSYRQYDPDDPDGSRFAINRVDIGNWTYVTSVQGSLDKGVMVAHYDYSNQSLSDNWIDSTITLPHRQIWTLKSFLVTP